MLHAGSHSASGTLHSIDLSETCFAFIRLTDLDLTSLLSVTLRLEFLLTLTISTRTMLTPNLVSVFVSSHLDPSFTDRTNDDVELVSITTNATAMVGGAPMFATEDLAAILALKWHEVTLMALRQAAMLAYIRF